MMKLKKILFILYISICSNGFSQSYLEFVENKGQWANNIAYKGELNTGAIALKPDGGYRMLQHNPNDLLAIHNFYHPDKKSIAAKPATSSSLGLHSHVYEVSFLGSNPAPQAIAEKPQESYNNYFLGNDNTKWATGCKIFQAVTYKNIYPNIDVRYYTGNGNLKYDFIVNPGGNPNQIALLFDGANELKTKKGNLIIKTSVAEEKELSPYTYQPTFEGRKAVECSYYLKGNILSFVLDNYDKTIPLIIDPTKVFATFTGSSSDNWGFTATYDNSGNFYAGGIVFGAGFPVSNGSSFQGGFNDTEEGQPFDMGIIKFNTTGTTRIYATYIGGSGNDQPHSLVVDSNDDLIIAGRTNSPNYPVTLPLAGPCGGRDIVITKLNSLGNILASKKIGGTGDDGINIKPKYSANPKGTLTLNRNYGDDARSEVIVDDANNILLASCTQSTDFFVTPNAFQNTNGGAGTTLDRKQDAVFIKATKDLSNIITSTYLGGRDDDAAFVLAIHPQNKNIYVAGGTASTDFPGNKTGVLQGSFQGGDCDGFVSILNSNGTQLLATSYMGTNRSENLYGIQIDKKGNPYIMGTTNGQWPIVNAKYNVPAAKQFIAKLQPDLSGFVYSTTFGTVSPVPNISPSAFLVDRCENVYVSGWGGELNSDYGYLNSGTSGLPITVNPPNKALQTKTDGSDFYFFVLERDANGQLYGDFFGQTGGTGEHVDGGTSRFDKEGIIYQSICANCAGGADFPTTPGAYSQSNGSTNCNLAAVKIAFNLSGIGAGVRSSIKGIQGNKLGCVPLTVRFIDTIGEGTKYYWNFGEGGADVKTVAPNNTVSYTYNAIGDYTVRLVSEDSTTCNIFDTSYVVIKVRIDSAILNLQFAKVGGCFSKDFLFDNRGSTFVPTKPFNSKSFLIYFGDNTPIKEIGSDTIRHTYPDFGIYKGYMILQDTNYCNTPDIDSFTVRIIDNVKARATIPAVSCIYDSVLFQNFSSGYSFRWYVNNVYISDKTTPKFLFPAVGDYSIKLIVEDTASCNKIDNTTANIKIIAGADADFDFSPKPPRINTPVNFINKSGNGGVLYKWFFGDGDSLVTTNYNAVVSHTFQATKLFSTCLHVYNANGCIGIKCKDVQARVNPLFDVPNAIAPEGTNKTIRVRGFGIKKIAWNIYNRWGTLVFSTNNINDAWDGRYKGEIQPQDVYHYTLIVEFFDDKKATKTGDITLLR